LNCAEIENRIVERTNAILPVRLYGHSANMDEILELGNDRSIRKRLGCSDMRIPNVVTHKATFTCSIGGTTMGRQVLVMLF